MSKIKLPEGMNRIQFVEMKLCEKLGLPHERFIRPCNFRFELPTGEALEQPNVSREALPFPVQEIMDEFLYQALTEQYDEGYKQGDVTGYREGYLKGFSDRAEGAPPQFEDGRSAPSDGYDGMPI
jgi:hypothetical protein